MLEGIIFGLGAVSPVGVLFLLGILMVVNLDIVGHVFVFGCTTPSQYVLRYISTVVICALDCSRRD